MRIFFIGSIPGHVPGVGQKPTGEHERLFEAAKELGYSAAKRSHTILIGSSSRNTIDPYVMDGVQRACRELPDREFFVEIHRPQGTRPPYPEVVHNLRLSRISYERDSEEKFKWMVSHVLALDAADVLIALGGGTGTRIVGHIAAERGHPLLAVASFGGSAKALYEKLKFVYKNQVRNSTALHYLTGAWTDQSSEELIGLAEVIGCRREIEQPHSYFISYAWPDSAVADHVEVLLHRDKRTVWRDEESVKAGESLANAIATLIHEADTFIAIWSQNYAKSTWCPNELEYARNRQVKGQKPRRIVLLAEDATTPPIRFTDGLRGSGGDRSSRELFVRKLLESEA